MNKKIRIDILEISHEITWEDMGSIVGELMMLICNVKINSSSKIQETLSNRAVFIEEEVGVIEVKNKLIKNVHIIFIRSRFHNVTEYNKQKIRILCIIFMPTIWDEIEKKGIQLSLLLSHIGLIYQRNIFRGLCSAGSLEEFLRILLREQNHNYFCAGSIFGICDGKIVNLD